MSGLADDFRLKAKNNIQTSAALIEAFDQPTRNVVLAVAGQVNGAMFLALADFLEYQMRAAALDIGLSQAAANLKKNDAIRKAAAAGDWNEYDRLVAGGEPKPTEPIVAVGVG